MRPQFQVRGRPVRREPSALSHGLAAHIYRNRWPAIETSRARSSSCEHATAACARERRRRRNHGDFAAGEAHAAACHGNEEVTLVSWIDCQGPCLVHEPIARSRRRSPGHASLETFPGPELPLRAKTLSMRAVSARRPSGRVVPRTSGVQRGVACDVASVIRRAAASVPGSGRGWAGAHTARGAVAAQESSVPAGVGERLGSRAGEQIRCATVAIWCATGVNIPHQHTSVAASEATGHGRRIAATSD